MYLFRASHAQKHCYITRTMISLEGPDGGRCVYRRLQRCTSCTHRSAKTCQSTTSANKRKCDDLQFLFNEEKQASLTRRRTLLIFQN
jgi:hypothetical protein